METKDIITISISSSALIFSIYATIHSNIKARDNKLRTIRELLTNVLDKVVSLQFEIAKIKSSHQQQINLSPEIDAISKQKKAFLLEEAVYLARQIPKHVQAFELNTIAGALCEIGNLDYAEEFYKKSISKSRNNMEISITKSTYAMLLFQTDRINIGRSTFEESIQLIAGDGDISKQVRGNIYKMWALSEIDFAKSHENAIKCIEHSFREYSSLNYEKTKIDCLIVLSELYSRITQQAPPQAPRSAETSS